MHTDKQNRISQLGARATDRQRGAESTVHGQGLPRDHACAVRRKEQSGFCNFTGSAGPLRGVYVANLALLATRPSDFKHTAGHAGLDQARAYGIDPNMLANALKAELDSGCLDLKAHMSTQAVGS